MQTWALEGCAVTLCPHVWESTGALYEESGHVGAAHQQPVNSLIQGLVLLVVGHEEALEEEGARQRQLQVATRYESGVKRVKRLDGVKKSVKVDEKGAQQRQL